MFKQICTLTAGVARNNVSGEQAEDAEASSRISNYGAGASIPYLAFPSEQ
jgi:hypothetical protein